MDFFFNFFFKLDFASRSPLVEHQHEDRPLLLLLLLHFLLFLLLHFLIGCWHEVRHEFTLDQWPNISINLNSERSIR